MERSEQKTEVVRGVYAGWSEGDLSASAEVFDPEVVLALGPDFPDAGTYSGIEAVAGYTRHLLEPWTRLTIEAEDVVAVGAHVLASVRQSGTGSGSGIATEMRYFMLWSFRGGKVIRIENFRSRSQALAAAGLDG